MLFSFSKLNKYNSCPHQFYRYYMLGEQPKEHRAMVFGSKVHKAISEMNSFNEELYDEDVKKMVLALQNNSDFQRFEIQFKEQKMWSHLKRKNNKYVYDFFGIFDAIAIHKETKQEWILEYKTSAREWSDEKIKDNILQHSIYREISGIKNIAYFIITKHKVPRLQYIEPKDFLSKDEILDVCDKIIQDFSFEPTQYKNNINNCYMCDYKDTTCLAWF